MSAHSNLIEIFLCRNQSFNWSFIRKFVTWSFPVEAHLKPAETGSLRWVCSEPSPICASDSWIFVRVYMYIITMLCRFTRKQKICIMVWLSLWCDCVSYCGNCLCNWGVSVHVIDCSVCNGLWCGCLYNWFVVWLCNWLWCECHCNWLWYFWLSM